MQQPKPLNLERLYYLNTVKMNRRGAPVDVQEITAIQKRIDIYTKDLTAELIKITGGGVQTANQIDKIRKFLKDNHALDLPNLQVLTVENCLDDKKITGVARRVLEIRHTVGKASVKKFKNMLKSICPDNTIKNNHIYHKASTGRYAGVNTQFQNLAQQRKGVIRDPEFSLFSFLEHSDELISFLHGGDVSDLAKDLVRSVIKASSNGTFICADYKGVESGGTSWECGEQDRINEILAGRDVYRLAAADMYDLSYEDIEKDSDERNAGKINELLGGYQGGWKAIIKGAKKYKIDLGEVKAGSLVRGQNRFEISKYITSSYRYQIWCDCRIIDLERKSNVVNEKTQAFKRAIDCAGSDAFNSAETLHDICGNYGLDLARAKASEDNKAYRASRPLLTAAWENFDESAKTAMRNPGEVITVPNVKPASFQLRGQFLFMRLPSGRELSYAFPQLKKTKTDWGEWRDTVTVMTAKEGKWVERGMYGGKWFQHYTQANCRDLLFYGQMNTENAGYPWILSVHDEGLAYVKKGSGHSLENFIEIFTKKPAWAEGFPLEASGWAGPRYHK